jgi:membrane protein involved in colicin uptake
MFRKFALTTTALVLGSFAIAAANPVWAQNAPCGEQGKVTSQDRMYDHLSKETDRHWEGVERYTAQADKYRSQAAQYRDLAANAHKNADEAGNAADKADWNNTAAGHQANADKLEAEAKAMEQRADQAKEEAGKSTKAASDVLEDCRRRQEIAAVEENERLTATGIVPTATPKKAEKAKKREKTQSSTQKKDKKSNRAAKELANEIAVEIATEVFFGEKRRRHFKGGKICNHNRGGIDGAMSYGDGGSRRKQKMTKIIQMGFGF